MRGVHVSSIVNEGIRALLNFFIYLFFSQEDFTRTKSTKRIQANKNKKDSIFMCIKTSKVRKVACSLICIFVIFMLFLCFLMIMFYNFSFWLKFLEIQLFFSILILSSIALKCWNFPHNFDFKGKIVAKFLIRSHFLSI